MSRGYVWWGTAPLVVGAAGLLLLAIGAKGMQDPEAINAQVRQSAEKIEQDIINNATDEDMKEVDKRQRAAAILQEGQYALQAEGREVDLQSLAPKKGQKVDADYAAQVRDFIEQQLTDKREPGSMVAQRIAFYGGLVLVFAAGVLLYRRTPQSVRGAW